MIILASASKKRSELLLACGIKHRVYPSRIKEDFEISKPRSCVQERSKLPHRIAILNAKKKAETVSKKFKSGFIIAADTIAVLNKKIIGKPKDKSQAKELLKKMSGKQIQVYTGLCIVDVKNRKKILDYQRTKVRIKKIKDRELSKYLKLLSPYDKAGGFSIEGIGSFIFDDIRGSYFNVLGLPLSKLKEMFEKISFDILSLCKITTRR